MPIGENSIKRVENNGYSKVNTACPDMENSTVVVTAEKPIGSTAKKCKATEKVEGFVRYSFGQELPYWLL